MKKKLALRLVDWLLARYASEWHRHKNPVRGPKGLPEGVDASAEEVRT